MPQKYVRTGDASLLMRHTGPTTLPETPPAPRDDHPQVVCLHDAGLQGSVFEALLDALAGPCDAIAFDLPGHGRSTSLEGPDSIAGMVEVARKLAAWATRGPVVLLGHGMGALVALEWARRHREEIRALVLCNPGGALGIDDAKVEAMRAVTQGKAPRPFDPGRLAPGADPGLMKRAYMEGLQTDPRATLIDLVACRAWDGRGAASEIALPAIVVAGDHEPRAALDAAKALADDLPFASHATLEAAAALAPLQQPEALAALVDTFLRGLS